MIQPVLLFITGITLFLFAMLKLSTGMQQALSSGFRRCIGFAVTKRFYGLLSGVLATILFQSSSATTLLTVGMVSAGLVSFYDSLSIILGADIGTTVTVQFMVWKVTAISPVLIFIGGTLFFFTADRWKTVGEALLYFGLIFFGLSLVGEAVIPLKNSETFIYLFREARHPLVGIGVGLIFTAMVHASAIPIGILVVLGQHGLIGLENALPIVLGANIGTTATALLGSTVTNINGTRAAFSHFLFKAAGALICLLLLPLFLWLLKLLSSDIPQQIAFSHFIFNLFIAVLFIFLLRPFAYLVERILPGSSRTLSIWPQYLEKDCLLRPEDALACVRKELKREIALSQEMFTGSLSLVTRFSAAKKRDIMYVELIVDNLQAEIVGYLWNISCIQLSPELSKRLFAFSTIVYDIERIGDRSTNLVELAESKEGRKALFSPAAHEELSTIGGLVAETIEDAASLLDKKDHTLIDSIGAKHDEILGLVKDATERHLERFYSKACRAEAGPIFVDMLVNLKWISDHCQTIAENIAALTEV